MDLQATASPNPTVNGQFRVHVQAVAKGLVSVRIFDTHGYPMGTLFEGNMQAGERREIAVERPDLQQGLYLIRVQSGQQSKSMRVEVQK